jgi:hypothetical protein
MVFAVLLLLAFQKSIRFENAARSHHQYSWSEAIFLPYTLDIHQMGGSPWCCMRRQKQASGIDCLKCLEEKSKATIDQARHSVQQTDTAGQLQQQNSRLNEQMSPGSVDPQKEKDTCEKEVDEFCLRIIVCMPSGTLERLVMNWEMYDLIIEIFGVAIYFYATFVMMTLLFVASVPALRFIALVAGSYIGVRAVGLVF